MYALILIAIISVIIILFLQYLYNIKYFNKIQENFLVTWTPYTKDIYNQPGYSNYFYKNNYMYPVY